MPALLLRACIALCAAAAAAQAALTLADGKLAVVDSALASAVASTTFTSTEPAAPLAPRTLGPTDQLKLSFSVLRDGAPLAPQHAAVLAQPALAAERGPGRDWQSPVKVRPASGKARWDLDLAHAPSALLSLASVSPLELILVLGHPHESPLALPLGTFTFPPALTLPFPFPPDSALPPHWEVERYHALPTLEWTFREPSPRVRTPVALVGLAAVLSPWIVLLAILPSLLPSLRLTRPRTLSLALLLACVVAFELLFVLYWVRLRLLPTLPAFAALAALTAWTGRGALGEMRVRRRAAAATDAVVGTPRPDRLAHGEMVSKKDQ